MALHKGRRTRRHDPQMKDHVYLFVGRMDHDEVGRPRLTIIGEDESVLIKEGDKFYTFLATVEEFPDGEDL